MKILQINAVSKRGSTGRTCKELAEYINSTDNSCYTAFAEGIADEYSYRIGSTADHKLHAVMSRLSGKQGYYSKKATKKFIAYINELNPDIIHLRNLHSNYINFPMLMKFITQKDIATVVTLHDCWFYTGKCCHYTVDKCYKWMDGCGGCPRLSKDNPSFFADATSKMWYDKKHLFEALPRLAVVGVSDWITAEAGRSYLSCARILKRIYNWIDLNAFHPVSDTENAYKRLELRDKKMVLGVASYWQESKGIKDFIELRKILSDDYEIVLIGHMSTELTLPKGIINIPATESVNELAEYYSLADVFITFSLEETFGKVSAEALACGTPVICYDSTANPELVGTGCGCVVDSGDINGVAYAVENLCNTGKTEISQICRNFAINNFDKTERIKDYIKLYEELASL